MKEIVSKSSAGSSNKFDESLKLLFRKTLQSHHRAQSSESIISSMDCMKGTASKSSADSINKFDDLFEMLLRKRR